MSAEERNKATVRTWFENLGPGLDHWKAANREALADDHVWWIQGWPTIHGMDEHDCLVDMVNVAFGVIANPILDFRTMDAVGDKVFMERRGSFADANGTVASWDIMGVYCFSSDGKIQWARDYFDGGDMPDVMRRVLPAEQIAHIKSQATHTLSADYVPNPTFYRQTLEQLMSVSR